MRVPPREAGRAGGLLALEPHVGGGAPEAGGVVGVEQHRVGVALDRPALGSGTAGPWGRGAGAVLGRRHRCSDGGGSRTGRFGCWFWLWFWLWLWFGCRFGLGLRLGCRFGARRRVVEGLDVALV